MSQNDRRVMAAKDNPKKRTTTNKPKGKKEPEKIPQRPISAETPIYDQLCNELGDPMKGEAGVDAA